MQNDRIIDRGDAQLCAQAFGDPSRPTLLLVAGTSCSMDWWPPDFCTALAGHGFQVLRFDQRDTGRATCDPPGRPRYGLPDLVGDALTVLDAHGVTSATWVGFSQGGWISQLAALDHPARVSGLVLMSTRPTGHGPADTDLPEVTDELLATWATATEPDWGNAHEVVEYLVDGERSLAAEPFDEPAARAVAGACVRRARQVRSAVVNHPMAEQGPRWRERLGRVGVPTLVLHGDRDPLFPVGNAVALTQEIHGAHLAVLPGVGHELPRRVWRQVVEHVTAAAGGRRASSARSR
jgi:pimeloyl-ACP methyl ester carboxylesterase